MKRRIAIIAVSLLVMAFSKSRPASAEGAFDCDDVCVSASDCATEDCILCDHPPVGDAQCKN